MSLCRQCKPGCLSNYYCGDDTCPRCRKEAWVINLVLATLAVVVAIAIKCSIGGVP